MAIKLDISTTSVVVFCTDCGHWRAFAWTKTEGEAAAIRHEELVHPDSFAARNRAATRARVRRHRAM